MSRGARVSSTDYAYGYGRALQDAWCGPCCSTCTRGKMRWRTSAGDELEAHLGQDNTKDVTSQAWRTALDPEGGEWMPAVLSAADRRLTEIRHHVTDAGGSCSPRIRRWRAHTPRSCTR